jgi:predicted ester cyclase
MLEQNKSLVRHLIEEVWNQGKLTLVDELLASDYLEHQPRANANGIEGEKEYIAMLRTAFSDIHFTVEDQIAEGDKVVTRWTACATHMGEFLGIAPTGRHGVVTGIWIDRIANGKFVEGWWLFDELGMMQQLGVVPVPE